MPTLIDGYNFLFGANIVAEEPGPYSLEKSRRAVLRYLVSALTPEERTSTTVVFDGHLAPPGLPREATFRAIRVIFSAPGEEADDLIERLLPTYSAPRQLTVVSSDHRVQRAARRRKARAIDSEAWYIERGRLRQASHESEMGDPPFAESDAEVEAWLAAFGDEDVLSAETEDTPGGPAGNRPTRLKATGTKDDREDGSEVDAPFENPFPDGYGEDLLGGGH